MLAGRDRRALPGLALIAVDHLLAASGLARRHHDLGAVLGHALGDGPADAAR